MRYIKIFAVAMLTVFILAACTATTETATPVPTLEIPIPGADTGVVTGTIISASLGTPPVANLYLSENLTTGRTDVPPLFSFSYQSNPRGVMDANGTFHFKDVPVGTYVITLWTPPDNAEFVRNASDEDYLWVVVEAGKVLDLGEVIAP